LASGNTTGSVYSQPLPHLEASDLQRFAAGRSEFAARWVPPFVSGGHWGRGPQSNAESCIACHPANGRGRTPDGPQEEPHALSLRLAQPGSDRIGRPRPHPAYGTHLNREGILGQLVEEGDFRIAYQYKTISLTDGRRIELRYPVVRFVSLWYGPIGNETIVSLRLAQPVFGLGLLEAVAESTLHEIAARQQRLGFNGRVNIAVDEARGKQAVGRFGHKASQPSLRQQTAAAFHEEIGVTSNVFPQQQCWPIQKACYRAASVSGVEARDEQIELITDYLQLLAPPKQRNSNDPLVVRGKHLFENAQCAVCHVPELKTSPAASHVILRERTIRPYTDLLLHDMGPGLADGRREFKAGTSDWRTAPLWGIGLRAEVNGNTGLLHDGRARNIVEAILWHGGEADVSRRAFIDMSLQDQLALTRFVESL
ncbi:MAG: thiol oxidoreductase, partial [Burkholderiales bacterium]|nr:thiol oxidoreductase [Burkholderiales bacterium]